MFSLVLLGLSALCACVHSSVVPSSSDGTGPAAHAQASASNVSANNDLQISCNAPVYGQNLKVPSCKNVFNVISKDTKQFTFAERGAMVPYDLPLPYRLQSKDGFCYVQVVLAPGASSGNASSLEVGTAAITLLEQCVKKYGYGGEASKLGGDNKLKVIMSSYKPRVKCSQRPAPPWQSTVSIFAGMDATKDLAIFGRAGVSGVEITLPLTVKAIDARAIIVVDFDGRSATSSWYEIWEAVNAIAYMCVRPQRKGGRASGIGSLSNIKVDLLDEHPDLSQPVTSIQNISSLPDLLLPIEIEANMAQASIQPDVVSNVTVV